ncbi:MAG: PilZ domain-containing protein [Nitrospiraceae bacterium]|nr:MAG: PilZ domain-containing protein [Nitrospiraceae bacterium]
MEKRHHRRIPVRLEAFILTDDKTYMGSIENISENGFEYLVHSSIKAPEDFHYEKTVEIYFQVPSGEAVNMLCTVKWLSKSPSPDKPLSIGIKIAEPSPKFKGLIQALDIVSVN